MRERRNSRRLLVVSALAVPVGALWAYSGLAECDRADCGAVVQALYDTSWVGVLMVGLGVVGLCVAGVGLVVKRFRR